MQRPHTAFDPHCTGGLDRRRFVRRRPKAVFSSIGPVVDLSAGGMRVLSTRPFQGEFDVTIEEGGEVVLVRASVKWRWRVGFRAFLIGLAFVDVTPPVARVLLKLSLAG